MTINNKSRAKKAKKAKKAKIAKSSRSALRPSLLALAVSQVLWLPLSHAAEIVVDSTGTDTDPNACTLIQAIQNANSDSAPSGSACVAGSGADVIVLPDDATFSFSKGEDVGTGNVFTVTPFVKSVITIEGNGSTIERSENASNNFRLFTVFARDTQNYRGDLTLKDLTIRNGNLSAIYVLGDLSLENTTIIGNTSTNTAVGQGGGAIFVRGIPNNFTTTAGTVTLNNSTISGNTAVRGGGILAQTGTVLSLNNSTVSANTAMVAGGGIYGSVGTVNLNNSIVAGNDAVNSSGDAGNGAEIHFISTTVTGTNNLFGDNSHTYVDAFTNFTPANYGVDTSGANGTLLSNILSPLSDNGGPTPTHSLPVGSPAINGGMSCEATDQRGVTRDVNQCDIGAFERVGMPGDLLVNSAGDSGMGCTLRAAITSINQGASLAECGLMDDPQGLIIDPSLDGATIELSLRLPVIKKDLNIYGSENNGLTIDANQYGPVLSADGASVILNHVTLTGGSAGPSGGGLTVINESYVSLVNSFITLNTSDKGGGVYVKSSSLILTNTEVSGNSASSYYGGGIYAGENSIVNLNDSTISGNSASRHGGGIFATDASVDLNNSTVSGNSSSNNGGGIYAAGASVTLSNSTVSGNSSDRGGGVFAFSGNVTLSNSTVSGNSASRHGGGIFATDASVDLNNSTVSGNSSSNNGGGIYAADASVTLSNSTVSGNSSDRGGGISAFRGNVTLNNSTVSENSASKDGGGISATYASVTLSNSIIANSLNGGDCYVNQIEYVTIPEGSKNIIEDGTCGTDALSVDPKLGPLRNNGGPTQTHALLEGSPAIDAGDNDTCTVVDQRGETRPFGAACDIGAVEFSARDETNLFVVPLSNGKSVIFGL